VGKVHYIIDKRVAEARVPTGWLSGFLLCLPEDSLCHPQRSDEHMRGIREKCGPVAFDQVAEPRQRESSWDEQQRNDPVEPDHNHRREADWDGDQVERTV